MRNIARWVRLTTAIAVVAGLTACADAPSAPVAAGQTAALAASFDAMAQEDAMAGAFDRSDDWHWIAAALREGVQPSRIEIWTFDKMEEYDAFVRATEAPQIYMVPKNEADHVMFAWQRDNSERINHLLRLTTPGDNGRILPHGGVHSVIQGGAHADYGERGNVASPWDGLSGVAKIAESWTGGSCRTEPAPEVSWRPPEGMRCQKAAFAVRFEAAFQSRAGVPEIQNKLMWMAEQRVIGVKLTPKN